MPNLDRFNLSYATTLRRILDARPVRNERTGKYVRAIEGVTFNVATVPLVALRDIKTLWTCAEAVWFMGGLGDIGFMKSFGFKSWDMFADSNGHVDSATGLRWRHEFGVDQLQEALSKLKTDRSNRQAVMLSWNPAKDVRTPGKNVPCVVIWHVHVIDDKLHMTVLQRSADMYFGFPHDVLGSRIVQELMAADLDAEPGTLTYVVSNAHLYEDQWENAEEMVTRARLVQDGSYDRVADLTLGLEQEHCIRAMAGEPAVALEIHDRVKAIYNPWPPLSGPKLVR